MKIYGQRFFLAANSAEGFVSHFADCYIPGDWRAYIVKGGPGTGKSGLMKYIAAKAANSGHKVVFCPCSSDPDSLDAVIVSDLKTVVLDGTAPHTVEPRLPGACENIINTGDFWNGEKLYENAEKIMAAAGQNARFHKTAAAYISAAGELILDNLKLARNFTDFAAAGRYALRQAARRLPQKRGETGREFVRFLGGVTPKGVIGFSKTVTDFYNDIVVISDKRGAASGEIMRALRAAAISRGYDIITVKNPFLPSELIDHILIPGLSLAFVTENDYITFDTPVRRVHARRFTDENALKKYKSRTIFNRRVSKELLSGAVLALKGAKDVHDTLESYYIGAMDFAALTEFITEKTGEILK